MNIIYITTTQVHGDRGGGVHLATLGAAGNAAYAIIGMPRAHARKGIVRSDPTGGAVKCGRE